MAKNIIEKPPFEFSPSLYEMGKFMRYILTYNETDKRGQYLYWDQLKYRVEEGDDPKIAWWATKWARFQNKKGLVLSDQFHRIFTYCLPDSLQAKLYKISQLSVQGIAPSDSVKEQYLISSLITEEAISSSQLEGASTTRKVAKEMLVSSRKPKNEDEQMILNNYLLMKEIKRIKDKELAVDMILELHAIATKGSHENGNVPGALRKNDEIIIVDRDENILHQPPKYDTLIPRLQTLCDFANNEHMGENDNEFIHPMVKAIILHFMVGYEHPFADGNGRTARALFYWFMLKSGFKYFEYISISKLLKVAPKQYTLAYLYSEVDDNDLTYFIYYQVDIILRAFDELMQYLEKKSQEFEEMNEILKDSILGERLNFTQKDILKKAVKQPGRIFTANEVAVDYDIAANSARKYLKELVQFHLLASSKSGRTITYISTADLQEKIQRCKGV